MDILRFKSFSENSHRNIPDTAVAKGLDSACYMLIKRARLLWQSQATR